MMGTYLKSPTPFGIGQKRAWAYDGYEEGSATAMSRFRSCMASGVAG